MHKKNKIITISGYYGFNNMGDEAVLLSILNILNKKGKNIKPIILSNEPVKTSSAYSVSSINRWSIKQVVLNILQSNVLISGGGSLIQDVTGVKSLLYYLSIIAAAKIFRKRTMIYSQGIGPLNSNFSKKMVRFVLNYVDCITVRDEASKNLLKKIGVNKDIKVTADPVLCQCSKDIDLSYGRNIIKRNGISQEQHIIGIAVRNWDDLKGYKKEIAKIADKLVLKGYQVLFVPFHFPDDISACRDTMRIMEKDAFIMKDNVSVEEMFSLIGNLELMIGMRLHSLIMSAVMNVPMVGISYDPKIDNFLKIVSQPNAGRVETLTEEVLSKNIFKILNDTEGSKEELRVMVDKLKLKAEYTADLVIKLTEKL
jgi:polysaccharide pyruvyl transferase CsaB